MAVKSIWQIQVDDGKFRDFQRMFSRYQAALKSTPAAWALVTKNIDGSRASFDKVVAKMAAANVQAKLLEKAQERADRLTRTSADRWRDMAKNTREFAANIGNATTSLLKWASITGVIGGLIGAGGLFGIDRLALGVGAQRRSALGLGTGIGNQAAFTANFGRLVDPESFLNAVAGAKFDLNKRTGLIAAGLTPQQIGGDTAQASVALLRSLKRLADTTDPALFAQALQARRLDQFAAPTDLERLRNTSPEEFERLIAQYGARRGQFDPGADVARKWQDLATQLDNAKQSIETTLIRGLVGLTPGLTKLSDAVSKIFGVLVEKGGPLERWVDQIGGALERFAGYIGTPEFEQSVETFVSGMGKIAEKIASVVSYFGTASDREESQAADKARRDALRRERAEGKATALGQLGRIFGVNDISMDQLGAMVIAREGSGPNSVSPKGAIGRYQIMPDTARQYGADPGRLFDPAYNEEVAKKILADLARRYHGNVSEILAAYNAGPGRADKYRAAGDDPRVLPAETQKYIGGSSGVRVHIEDSTGGSVNVSANGLKD